VIPDLFVKQHVKYLINMLVAKMGFKSIFIHQESVMATYAMALPSACVIDIGSSKISVCCIDEGVVAPKSIIRRHFGGDDLAKLFYRLLSREKALHYIPRGIMDPDYHYHWQIIENLKEQYAMMKMDNLEIVKQCVFYLKNRKAGEMHKVQFNCSETVVHAGQGLFHSRLLLALQKAELEVKGPQAQDPTLTLDTF